jgi:hypothetical protein
MKGFGCPKATLGLLGLIDQLYQLRGLLIIDNGHCAWPLFDNQPVDTALIEIWHIVPQKPRFFFNKKII